MWDPAVSQRKIVLARICSESVLRSRLLTALPNDVYGKIAAIGVLAEISFSGPRYTGKRREYRAEFVRTLSTRGPTPKLIHKLR